MTELQYNKFLKYAYNVSRSYSIAKDLVHEGWIRAREKNMHNDPSYISGCIANLWKDTVRDRRIAASHDKAATATVQGKPFSTGHSVQEWDIFKIYKTLSDEQKVIVENVWETPNYSAVARKLKVPRKTFHNRVLVVREIFEKLYGYENKERPRILCLDNGKIYNSTIEAAKALGVVPSFINKAINKHWKVKGLTLMRVL